MQRIKMSIKHEIKEERVTVIQEVFRKNRKMLACFTAYVLLDFLVTVNVAPHESIIRTGLP